MPITRSLVQLPPPIRLCRRGRVNAAELLIMASCRRRRKPRAGVKKRTFDDSGRDE
jgi:hypothetical protein